MLPNFPISGNWFIFHPKIKRKTITKWTWITQHLSTKCFIKSRDSRDMLFKFTQLYSSFLVICYINKTLTIFFHHYQELNGFILGTVTVILLVIICYYPKTTAFYVICSNISSPILDNSKVLCTFVVLIWMNCSFQNKHSTRMKVREIRHN